MSARNLQYSDLQLESDHRRHQNDFCCPVVTTIILSRPSACNKIMKSRQFRPISRSTRASSQTAACNLTVLPISVTVMGCTSNVLAIPQTLVTVIVGESGGGVETSGLQLVR